MCYDESIHPFICVAICNVWCPSQTVELSINMHKQVYVAKTKKRERKKKTKKRKGKEIEKKLEL